MPDLGSMNISLQESISEALQGIARKARGIAVFGEVLEEIDRAYAKHGPNDNLPWGTGFDASVLADAFASDGSPMWAHVPISHIDNGVVAETLKALNDAHTDETPTTRLAVLLEEVFEAACEEGPAELRAELIQVIAMATDWVLDIDAAEQ